MNAADIPRRRLYNSRLVGSPSSAPADVLRRQLAMQAQDYGPAKWSVAQRCRGLVDRDLDGALDDASIVRTHVLRPTWHFAAADDIRWLLRLTGPRVQSQNGPRYRGLGLDDRIRTRCERVLASALEGERRLTRDEVAEVLDREGIDRSGQRLPYILMHCELEAVICSGGLVGKKQTFALLDERVPADAGSDRDRDLVELVRRYLTSHGPATVRDLRWWSGLTIADLRSALHMLGSEVRSATIEGLTFWWVDDNTPHTGAAGARLLQAYDELIVGYTESRFFGDPHAASARAAWKDRSMPSGIVWLDGMVGGHWRRGLTRRAVNVELRLYQTPTRRADEALREEAAELGRFLGRDVAVERVVI